MDKKQFRIVIIVVLLLLVSFAIYFEVRNRQLQNNLAKLYLDNAEQHPCREIKELYVPKRDSLCEALEIVNSFKNYIENEDGNKLCWINGKERKESDLQLLFKNACSRSRFYAARECNNGRGPADFTLSDGAVDVTVIELKKANNSKLRANLLNQLGAYKRANQTEKGVAVIFAFNEKQENKVNKLLIELGLKDNLYVVVIDAKMKASASNIA